MKDGLWSIVSGSERPPDIAEGRQIREVCGKKGSCTGHYCFVGRTVATLSDWRTRRSNHCLEKVGWSVSKEDLGQQAGATAKAVLIAAERPRLRSKACQSYDGGFRCIVGCWRSSSGGGPCCAPASQLT